MIKQTNDFKTQYEQELLYQEVTANKNTLKGFLCFFIAVALIWILTMIGFFEVDKNLITFAFQANIVLFMPLLFICIKKDLSKPWLKYFFLLMMCVVSAVIISVLSYHAVLLYVFPLIFAVQYRKNKVIWYAYIINLVTITLSSITSFYYGICDLNILLQSQHVRDWYLNSITEDALNIPYNENPMFVIIVFMIFPRAIILLVFTILMQFNVISNVRDAMRIAQLTYYKNTDTNTNAYNKNKYKEMIETYYPEIPTVAVAFWDLNDLKKINDKFGHAMGDRAIEKLSSLLTSHAADACRIYRIGGDEFVSIIDNPGENQMDTMVTDILTKIGSEAKNEPFPFSVAVGYSHGSGKDILEIVKTADTNMYKNKKLCKEASK